MPSVSGISFPRLHCRQGRQHQDQSHFVGLISLEPSCSAVLSLCIVAKIGLIMPTVAARSCAAHCAQHALQPNLMQEPQMTLYLAFGVAGTTDGQTIDQACNFFSNIFISFFCSCSRSRRRNSQLRVLNFIQYTDLRTSMI